MVITDMNKWIAEFDLEDGDKMPEHMDLEYKGAKIDFHCRPLEQEPTTKNDLGVTSELEKNSKKLEKNFGESDCISRQAVIDLIADYDLSMGQVVKGIHALPSVTPQEPKCKDCKWWKDSDGAFRRGIGAESKCPMNRIEVYEGNGYCFLFEPQESESDA